MDLPNCHVAERQDSHPPESKLAPGASGTLDSMPGKQGELLDLAYFPQEPSVEMLFIDRLQEHWYSMFNEQAGLGLAVAWDSRAFPYLWLWQEHHDVLKSPLKEHVYVMALEPQSSLVPALADAVAEGKASKAG